MRTKSICSDPKDIQAIQALRPYRYNIGVLYYKNFVAILGRAIIMDVLRLYCNGLGRAARAVIFIGSIVLVLVLGAITVS
jgi:hypothetical protein